MMMDVDDNASDDGVMQECQKSRIYCKYFYTYSFCESLTGEKVINTNSTVLEVRITKLLKK